MADIYGEAGKNTYPIPGVTGFFSNTVNKNTGVTQVFIQGPLNTQQSVGTYNPNTKKFTPDANSTLTQRQITAISSIPGIDAIKKASTTTVAKEISKEPGKNPQEATNEANRLLNPNSASGGPVSSVTAGQLRQVAGREVSNTRNKFKGYGGNEPLKYPLNLKNTHQDVIKFNMVEYVPKDFSSTTFGFSERNVNRDIIGTVVLPIPNGISDSNAVNWGSQDMNAAQAELAAISLNLIKGGGSKGAETASGVADKIQSSSQDVKTAVANVFAEAATGVSGLLTRTTGLLVNPNMELLFQNPTLRPFNFTFKLSARSRDEAQAIKSIIRFFKQGMAPIRTESRLFLKTPHTFQIQYLHQGNPHEYLNKFKECALLSFNVDYTPEGQYATFSDGAMVSYQITMQFQELEPIFNDDYKNSENIYPDPDIGY